MLSLRQLIILIALLIPQLSFCPQSSAERIQSAIQLDSIIVSAKRTPQDIKQTAEDVIVVTSEEIKRFPARDVSEILSYVPGIDVQLSGNFGQPTSLSIRGSNSRQVLLMVDGVPFNTQLSGQANPAQIPTELIDKIEIVKSPSSSVWGSGIGGVVNVITKKTGQTAKPQFCITTSFAEFKTIKDSMVMSGKNGKTSYILSGSFFKTDGVKSISDTEEKKSFVKMTYDLNDQTAITGSFGYSGADVLYGPTPSSIYYSQPYNTRYGTLSLNNVTEKANSSIAYKYNDQEFTSDTFNASTLSLIFSTVNSNVYQGLSLNHSVEMRDEERLVLGSDFDWHVLKSSKYLSSSKTLSTQAPYANYNLKLGSFDFIPGLRYDHNERFGSQVSPSAGFIYHFNDENDSLVRAKVSRAFNAPPLLWIYNFDPTLFVGPNPDLKAERAVVYDIGFETSIFSVLKTNVSLYRSEVRDAIGLDFDAVKSLFYQKNFRKFKRQGAEIDLEWPVTDEWSFTSGVAFNDVKNIDTKQIVRDSSIARYRYDWGVHYAAEKDWECSLIGYYNRFSSPASSQPNDRKPMLDAKLSKKFSNSDSKFEIESFFIIHNITNSKYWSNISFPLPGRYFEGGLTFNF